ncbi:DUF4142 domain-containing protein [Dactylosporangium sp. CA-139066]|uniref:DUF4142 domain-containing protein n=1 Tax=Dactylosporangium sp. CA-139066 TaxID=3239930 RepID=UPI003D9489CA
MPSLVAAALTGTLVLAPLAAPPQQSQQDSAFITAAGYGGNFEVAGGQLAQARGGSPAVRAFGARMVTDHTRIDNQLAAIATKAGGATVPHGLNPSQQHIVTNWSRLNGQAFDCSYEPAAYLDHVGAIGLFQAEAAHGDNPDLVTFARQTLPTLQEHERMISAALTGLNCSVV